VSVVREPDLGLLAEYSEGLLEGTPEGAAVARRIATDERWAAAWAELPGALRAVRRDLAGLGPASSVPPEVAERLEATVAELRPRTVVRWSSRRRWLTTVGIAAAVATVVGVPLIGSRDTAPQESVAAPLPARIGAARITSTGTDYAAKPQASALGIPEGSAPTGVPVPVPAELTRLTDRGVLRACLEAVRRFAAAGAPVSADFARYGSRPAVVVVLDGGVRVAVGPACSSAGPDVVARLAGPP
jgi:hypothetical protein